MPNGTKRDLHADDLLSRASSRMYIKRTCTSYGYFKEQSTLPFDTLFMSLFKCGIEACGSALEKSIHRHRTIFI